MKVKYKITIIVITVLFLLLVFLKFQIDSYDECTRECESLKNVFSCHCVSWSGIIATVIASIVVLSLMGPFYVGCGK